MLETYPSKLIEDAVNEIAKLPGIGRRTALRLALHILKCDISEVEALGNSIINLRKEIKYCKVCYNISDDDICSICSNTSRDHSIICVVEDTKDVTAIEKTSQYKGVYHVLNGVISPIEGIGPEDLNIQTLLNKAYSGNIKEIIMALPATIEGDTTIFYLYKKLKDYNILISTIARGIAIGDTIEYTDEITLGRSIIDRYPYEPNIKSNVKYCKD
ncbi:MAG TPA: recombination mediator RecR [Bacteroidales bacterium]|nr:recombination mediator RecR [Bacteroidales bacterium]